MYTTDTVSLSSSDDTVELSEKRTVHPNGSYEFYVHPNGDVTYVSGDK